MPRVTASLAQGCPWGAATPKAPAATIARRRCPRGRCSQQRVRTQDRELPVAEAHLPGNPDRAPIWARCRHAPNELTILPVTDPAARRTLSPPAAPLLRVTQPR